MATTTSRLALYKAADDGSEYVDVSTNLNQNFDKIDAAIGFVPSTSTTPPSPTYAGMGRYDSDTGKSYHRNASNSGWIQLLNSGSPFDAEIRVQLGNKLGLGRSGTLDSVVDGQWVDTAVTPASFRVSGDTQPRVALSWDSLAFGPGGSTAPDIAITRLGSQELGVNHDLTVSGDLNVGGLTTVGDLSLSGDVTSDLRVDGSLTVTGVGRVERRVKEVSTTRANSTTVTSDPELVVALEANSSYLVKFYAIVGAVPAADFKTSWGVPSGTTGLKWCLGPDSASTSRDVTSMRVGVHVFTTEVSYGIASNTLNLGIFEQAVVTTTSSAGDLTINWAQVAANATGTVLVAGSLLEVTKIA